MILQIRELDEDTYGKIFALKAKKRFKKVSQAVKFIVDEWEAKK
jgi:hypothetical protein